MQKLSCILLTVAVATGVAGCTATEPKESSHASKQFSHNSNQQNAPRRSPKALVVNGKKFKCSEQELETKIVVRCVRET